MFGGIICLYLLQRILAGKVPTVDRFLRCRLRLRRRATRGGLKFLLCPSPAHPGMNRMNHRAFHAVRERGRFRSVPEENRIDFQMDPNRMKHL